MRVFKIVLNNVLEFLSFLVDRALLKFLVTRMGQSLTLKLKIGLVLKLLCHELLLLLWVVLLCVWILLKMVFGDMMRYA